MAVALVKGAGRQAFEVLAPAFNDPVEVVAVARAVLQEGLQLAQRLFQEVLQIVTDRRAHEIVGCLVQLGQGLSHQAGAGLIGRIDRLSPGAGEEDHLALAGWSGERAGEGAVPPRDGERHAHAPAVQVLQRGDLLQHL